MFGQQLPKITNKYYIFNNGDSYSVFLATRQLTKRTNRRARHA